MRFTELEVIPARTRGKRRPLTRRADRIRFGSNISVRFWMESMMSLCRGIAVVYREQQRRNGGE